MIHGTVDSDQPVFTYMESGYFLNRHVLLDEQFIVI